MDARLRSLADGRNSNTVAATAFESSVNGLHADGVSKLFFLSNGTQFIFVHLGRGFSA